MVNRSNILFYLVVVLFSLLAIRLFSLQIVEFDKYKNLAKNNTTRTSLTRAPRGIIYDRDHNILATSKQSLSVIVFPGQLRDETDKATVAGLLANFIEISEEDLRKIFTEMDPSAPLPIVLDNDVTIETAIKIYENKKALPGIAVEEQATRYYPFHEIGAHLLGYIGQINNQELKDGKSRGLSLGDVVGKDGLERVFDAELQGINGESRVAVDRYGKSLAKEEEEGEAVEDKKENRVVRKAVKGKDVVLTVRADLQQAAQDALGEKMGAAVALNPKNGEIYALVSSPSFDPNIFTKPVPAAVFNELMGKKAFIDRAISTFTPGSIWKPFTSLAALEHQAASSVEILPVSGSFYYGGFRFGDWTGESKMMDIKEALVWSRNTFFYQIAKRMKPEWITDLAKQFGAGKRTGVELFGEAEGTVPDPEWKKKVLKEPWFPGNTLHLAIGQSYLLLSPIQVVKMYSGIANEGFVPQPHLIQSAAKEKLEPVNGVSKETFALVKEALEQCVERGTGQASKFEQVKVAGKTGSAEVPGYAHSTHGWFASYAPAEDPEIVVVVFVEGGGHGGSVAAPVAKKIYEVYFKDLLTTHN